MVPTCPRRRPDMGAKRHSEANFGHFSRRLVRAQKDWKAGYVLHSARCDEQALEWYVSGQSRGKETFSEPGLQAIRSSLASSYQEGGAEKAASDHGDEIYMQAG